MMARTVKRSEREIALLAAESAGQSLSSTSPDIGAGRLDPEVLSLQRVAAELLSEAQTAYATFQTAVVASKLIGDQPARAKGLDLVDTNALFVIHRALTQQGLLGAYRLTDAPSDDRQTLCGLVRDLTKVEQRLKFCSEEWAAYLGHARLVVPATAAKNAHIVQHLKATIPLTWPSPGILGELRDAVRDYRNKYLAHYIPDDLASLTTYDDVERLVAMTLELATDAALLLKGGAVSAETFKTFARENAERFWSAALEEPRRAWLRHENIADNAKLDHKP